jgi:hypothetical protein
LLVPSKIASVGSLDVGNSNRGAKHCGPQSYCGIDESDGFRQLWSRTRRLCPKVGQSREGYPIFLYTDPQTKLVSYVVVLPDGRVFSSDSDGRILTTYGNQANVEAATAIVLGTGGLLLGGPIGGIVGALAGAIVGSQLKKSAA